jgi:hypothetical protein
MFDVLDGLENTGYALEELDIWDPNDDSYER